tara:strand:- start:10 stop:2475 length:2466 start_codon:yes stop_codon:yes gene_type:complete
MKIAGFTFNILYWVLGKFFSLWVRPKVQPAIPSKLITDDNTSLCYVLETGGFADILALERVCRIHKMPSPMSSFIFGSFSEKNRIIVINPLKNFWFRGSRVGGTSKLKRLVENSQNCSDELLLIPVAIFWGRSPDKERSLFKLMLSENWGFIGRTKKLLITLLHGRNTLVHFDDALLVHSTNVDDMNPSKAYRKVFRILRVHFQQRRTTTIGPDLSHRRTLIEQVIQTPAVLKIIDDESGKDNLKRAVLINKSRKYALEIAADISYPTIHIFIRLLRWLFSRLYEGLEVNHMDRLHKVSKNKEIIYVPCHRSHMDYLLLGYITYEEGLHLPHVAAGINLNMPIVGSILRRGGAFFLRRSFKGNRLYAAVFDAYINQILVKGHSMEYFIEGGRSRTGKLLNPKGGMLAMTIHSYVKNPHRQIIFVPVYFGYEKLIEGNSFINELSGVEKKKETIGGLISSINSLREKFGKVYVNIGEPIELEPILDNSYSEWREYDSTDTKRPPWLTRVVNEASAQIMQNINSAAAITPVCLLAYTLLSSKKQRISLKKLQNQIEINLDLLKKINYSKSVTLPDIDFNQMIHGAEKIGVIHRCNTANGEFIETSKKNAALMNYFKNNILHLFSLPATISFFFLLKKNLEFKEMLQLIHSIYPYLKKDLSLKWSIEDIDQKTLESTNSLVERGLLAYGQGKKLVMRPNPGSDKESQLFMLGQSIAPMLQRFYLLLSILKANGIGTLDDEKLIILFRKGLKHLSLFDEFHSLELFNKTLLNDLLYIFKHLKIIWYNSSGYIEFDNDPKIFNIKSNIFIKNEIYHGIQLLLWKNN